MNKTMLNLGSSRQEQSVLNSYILIRISLLLLTNDRREL